KEARFFLRQEIMKALVAFFISTTALALESYFYRFTNNHLYSAAVAVTVSAVLFFILDVLLARLIKSTPTLRRLWDKEALAEGYWFEEVNPSSKDHGGYSIIEVA